MSVRYREQPIRFSNRCLGLLIAGAFAGLFLVSRAANGQPPALQPDDPNAEPTLTLSPAGAFQLNNDSLLRRWFKDAKTRLESGQFTEGLTLLQRILDRGDDAFVRMKTDSPLVGIRNETLKAIGELPHEGHVTYQRLFEPRAKRLWNQAQSTGRAVYAAEALRRYFHTSSGFDASRWLAAKWLDAGDPKAAARLWDRLLAEPVHRERITLAARLEAAIAHQLAGNDGRALQMLGNFDPSTFKIAGETRSGDHWRETFAKLPTTATPGESNEWLMPAGDVRRNRSQRGSVPWLSPLWTADVSNNPALLEPIRNWLETQAEQMPQRVSVASEPLVVRGQVVFRDGDGISAIDLRSGRATWRFRARVPLDEVLRRTALIALNSDRTQTIFEAVVGHSAWGTLSSDGQSVFAVDYVPVEAIAGANVLFPNRSLNPPPNDGSPRRPLDGEADAPPFLTRLVALPAVAERAAPAMPGGAVEARPIWSLDGITAANQMGQNGCGIQFLGPPAVRDGCLYVFGELFSLAEFDTQKNSQISLLAIDALTGELLWTQGLALVDQPFFRRDQQTQLRRNPLGAPSIADGILVCPTDVGLIVGIDLVTGRQRWVYDYRPVSADNRRRIVSESSGWSGLPAWPVIHRGRVVLVPRFSDQIHCLDVATGNVLWKTPRLDTMYVGAAMDDSLLLVGEREVRSVPLFWNGAAAGQSIPTIWSQRLGTITGRGARVGEHYLVPLKSGRVASLELATGRDRGFALRRTTDEPFAPEFDAVAAGLIATWPGNLVACDDIVLSLGPERLIAYPQAHAKLAEVQKQTASVERRLLESELSVLLGSGQSPVAELQQVLREPLTPDQRRQAELQLRESLYLELDRDPTQADALLVHLERLANTPTERARMLRRLCEVSLRHDPARTVQAARALAELPLDHEWELEEHGQHVVSVETWARGFLRQVRARVEQFSDDADRVADLLNADRDRLLTANDLDSLRRFVRLCDDWPQATDVRFRLSDLLIAQGRFQEAELLLQRDRGQADPRVAAAASVRLLRLWDHLGLYAQAAGLLTEFNERFADVELPESAMPARAAKLMTRQPLTGRTFVAAFPRETLTGQAFAQRQAPAWDVRRITITEDRNHMGDSSLLDSYDQFRRRYQTPPGMAFHLFEKQWPPGQKDESAWNIVDRDSGVIVGQLTDLDRVFYPSTQQFGALAGSSHFLPLGGPARYRGVSLLERDSLECNWDRVFSPLRTSQEFLRVGPSGPGFCSFQSRQHLLVADPTNGRLLWRRGNLEPQSGLFAENEWGLFGDQEALVLFAQDFSSYVVYETATGRELRRGRLNIDLHQNRRVFGRKLFYVTDGNNGRRIRIWDPLTDQNEFDEPFGVRLHSTVTADGELLIVLPTGQIRIIDVNSGMVMLNVTIPAEYVFGLNQPKAFSDHGHYYINLQRSILDSGRSSFSYFLNDSLLPKADVQGELYTFARPSAPQPIADANGTLGKRMWTRVMPQRMILRLDYARLPFLIALSRMQDRQNHSKSAIRVEAIDRRTGETLAIHSHIVPDRFVQTRIDAPNGRAEIVGLRTKVRLDFGRDRMSRFTLDEPL